GALGRSPESHQQRTEESMGKLYPRLVGILPTGRRKGADLSAGRLDTTAHPEVFLVAVAQPQGSRAKPARAGREGAVVTGRLRIAWGVEDRSSARDAKGAEQGHPSENRFLNAVRSRGDEPLSSTAGCGKPHVRWCGRVTGRDPRHSTRSYNAPD